MPNEYVEINIYLDDGIIYCYEVKGHASAREHISAIIKTGYRSTTNGCITHFPPHRILKVKGIGESINTQYPDRMKGT